MVMETTDMKGKQLKVMLKVLVAFSLNYHVHWCRSVLTSAHTIVRGLPFNGHNYKTTSEDLLIYSVDTIK